jgi:hypothetical protein
LLAVADLVTTLATVVVLGFITSRLVGGLRATRSPSGRAVITGVRRRVGWRHVWPVPVLLAVVLAAATLAMQVPGLDWGWWTALGGDGNPVFGSSQATAGTSLEWIVPLVFMTMLLPALPLFANAEERIFRAGAEHWSLARRVAKTLQFGMVHALIGIPLGAALALSIGGAYFMWVYLREFATSGSRQAATLESTTAHTVYNGVIIVLVYITVIWVAVAGGAPA